MFLKMNLDRNDRKVLLSGQYYTGHFLMPRGMKFNVFIR